ncbi:MAG: hypothetical protein HKM00_00085 [Gallionella sp.]|jgi:hypothetical protein|nr:hypothetical protein [Gallionella sp.]
MKTPLRIAALCFALAGLSAARAEELGRLFFTPAQRAQQNYGKLQEGDAESNSRSLTVNGIVQRHGGARTAWINGVPRLAGQSDEGHPGSLPVTVPSQAKPVTVKVGQKVNIDPANDGSR